MVKKMERLAVEKGITTEIVWIPRHTAIKHNDKVDEEAKKAAKSKGCDDASPKASLPLLKSARLQLTKQSTKEDIRNGVPQAAKVFNIANVTLQAKEKAMESHDEEAV